MAEQLMSREELRLEACASEPIRTPGTIQAHGALLAVDALTRQIIVVSENSGEFLGAEPSQVLGRLFDDVIAPAHILGLREAAEGASPADLDIGGRAFDAIVHRDGPRTFVELEPRLPFDERAAASAMYSASHRLSKASDSAQLLESICMEFRDLSGFDRVLVYHFHPDGHGEVVSEVLAEGMEPYLGLHFPASDIPAQARELYLTKLSRAIISTHATPVPLLGLPGTRAEQLDLTHAELRAVSPYHLQYMRNMGQASTLSISLIYRGELIGMITCSHRTERRLPYLVRRSLEVLANQIAVQLGAAAEIARLGARMQSQQLRSHLLSRILASHDMAGALLTGPFTVLDVIHADAALVRLGGTLSGTAGAPDAETFQAILRASGTTSAVATNTITTDFPDLAPLLPQFAGMLVVPVGSGDDVIAFFRHEVLQSIDWLGDLTEQNRAETLSPRLSFSAWRESVTGQSLPWNDLVGSAQLLAADVSGALLRQEESRLATLAMHDPLTGLGNRRMLMEQLDRIAATTLERALLFIDLDNFKAVNDTHGHEAGDLVIMETGRRLVAQTRADDRVIRLGGDEFVILCDNIQRDAVIDLAGRIAAAVREPIGPHATAISASVGIIAFQGTFTPSSLLEQADAAMFRAKQGGKDGISF